MWSIPAHHPARLALLGGLSFGPFALLFAAPDLRVWLLAIPLAGAVGGGVLTSQVEGWRRALAAALVFAFGFLLADVFVFFSLISLQAEVVPLYGATAWSIGLAIGGGIGGLALGLLSAPRCFRWDLGLRGALAFGLPGAIGGWLGFALFGAGMGMLGIAAGLFSALALGGALLGAAIGRSRSRAMAID